MFTISEYLYGRAHVNRQSESKIHVCGLNQKYTCEWNSKRNEMEWKKQLFYPFQYTSKKYFTVMYCAFGVCFFFFSSLFRPAHCKNWNSCGFQKSVYIYTKIHASFSLWTSLNINNNNKKKRGTTTRTISTTAKTSRKIYWPNIFDGFFLFHFVWMFCSGVLFYNRPNCVCVCVSWLSRQANKSFWIARISFSLSLTDFLWLFEVYCISWIIPMPSPRTKKRRRAQTFRPSTEFRLEIIVEWIKLGSLWHYVAVRFNFAMAFHGFIHVFGTSRKRHHTKHSKKKNGRNKNYAFFCSIQWMSPVCRCI